MRSEAQQLDSRRTEITPGAWYAPTRENARVDYRGTEIAGYRVTKPLPSYNGQSRWQIQCLKCCATKACAASDIKRGGSRIAHCKCPPAHAFDSRAVRAKLGMSGEQLTILLAVLSHERAVGRSPTRIEIVHLIGRELDTASLARLGMITQTWRPMVVSSTKKAWRELGFTRDSR